MPINISTPFNGESGDWIIPVLIVLFFFWLFTLILTLRRSDMEPVTQLMWVMVVIFVPIIGPFLYLFMASSMASKVSHFHSLSGTPWEKNPGHTIR